MRKYFENLDKAGADDKHSEKSLTKEMKQFIDDCENMDISARSKEIIKEMISDTSRELWLMRMVGICFICLFLVLFMVYLIFIYLA